MSGLRKLLLLGGLAALAVVLAAPAGASAAFSLKEVSVESQTIEGLPELQAGSHPFEYTVKFGLNVNGEGKTEGLLQNAIVSLPPGVVGNPFSTPRCSGAQFEGLLPKCPGDTQVGTIHFQLAIIPEVLFEFPIYNLTPGVGSAASLGFSAFGKNSVEEVSSRTDGDFGLNISDVTLPAELELSFVEETIWGVPQDPAHDAQRECLTEEGGYIHGCGSDVPPKPFLTMPSACRGPLTSTVSVSSLENPTDFASKSTVTSYEGDPTGFEGCNAIEFNPSLTAQPTTNLADAPTGLNFNLHQAQNEAVDGLGTGQAKDVSVTLPEGVTLNPSATNGLEVCSNEEIGYAPKEGHVNFSKEPQHCPAASKLGTVEVSTPVLDHKLAGSIYLAKPYENPFGTLAAIYLVVEDEQTGIIAKLGGKVVPDPSTGQLTTTFAENPQLPLEDVSLKLFNGPRAALKSPLACGKYTTTSTLTPWSTPEGLDVHPSDSFETSVAASGSGACPKSEAEAPAAFSFTAGTAAPLSGSFSPFTLRIARADGTQRLTAIETTLPQGLLGKLAGVSYCPESGIALAKSREAPEKGKEEIASPSCPASSEVGTVNVTAGAGINPTPVTGHAYLAGPYKGAALSMVVVIPAVAGPYDLGDVVSRVALNIGEYDARIHAVSDPLPTIIDGIPVDVRSIELKLDRSQFTLNPTSCEAMAVEGSATTQAGKSVPLTNRFQVGECKRLAFKPKLAISLKGGTKRSSHPALKAVLTYPKGGEYANIASAQVSLPHSEFLDNANIGTVCTQPQLKSNSCPPASIYGKAKAWTPLLEKPVEGNVYLGAGFGHKLPDLVAELNGQIRVLLHGKVDTDKQHGLRNTFEAVPDAPVEKFVLEMKGGKKGLLVNSEDICAKKQKAGVLFTAANGKTLSLSPTIANSCKGGSKGKKGKGKKGKGHR